MFNRYSRLAVLPHIGREGLSALKESRVLIVGCGALGSMTAMYLAASGIGTIGIADFDTIDLSNLQRQLFFDEKSVGSDKAATLAERMSALNSDIRVVVHNELITREKARKIFPDYDFIIDGSDNPPTKMLTDEISLETGRCCCIGGVREFSGQVISCSPDSVRYADVFGEAPCSGVLPCSIAGVLGPAAGVVASVQAAEAIKHATRAGNMLFNRLFTIDLLNGKSSVVEIG
jgi:adenylyltransferase/sulfurtransferase